MSNNYIIDKSFQMIRTNPRLTTNIKINVDTEYGLYLETFDSNKQLNDDKYKHFPISYQSYYEDKLPIFYDGLPMNLAYEVKNNDDKDIVYNNFSEQFDDLYWSGVKKIEQNKFYSEEFEYFAPLYMKYKDIPENFIIMRVDNLGVYEQTVEDYQISNTNSDNFRPELIDKWKCVTNFDLTVKSKLGNWINQNFIENERFPDDPFEFDSNSTNFSRWYGIDYTSGSFTEKSRFITDKIWFEQPHFRLEEYITDGFKDNGLVYPNILNMNYLFDDNPATPYKYNKYSLNRYFGFYVDMEKIETLTSYKSEVLRISGSSFAGLDIINNIFIEIGNPLVSVSPFFDTDDEWNEDKQYYIYIVDDLFEVIRIVENGLYSYNIVSKYTVDIGDICNNKEMDIEFYEYNLFDYKNKIVMRNSILHLDRIIKQSGSEDMPGDLYLIEIDEKYHVIEFDDITNEYLIRTDYGISSDDKELKYWVEDINKAERVLTHDFINHDKPIVFDIFKVSFRDVKDFDFNRVDTGYADFDFDQEDEYVETQEHKLYCVEHRDASLSTVFKEYDESSPHYGKRVIASSEYVADDELYEVTKEGLTGLWDKNQSVTKWAVTGSISHADYPYKLNNSNKIGSTFNNITNTLSTIPDITTKTNDYFYRIGTFISGTTDGYDFEYKYYKTQSLSIETDSYNEPQFNLDLYLDSELDYFDYFFNNKRYINNLKEYIETQQFSVFNSGSKYNPSTSLFKGIKYEVMRVQDVIKDENHIVEKILTSNNDFNQYKFCVIGNYYQSGYTGTTYDNEQLDIINNRVKEYPLSGVKTTKADLSKDGIHVFLNDKYKNILVIVNMKSIVNPNTLTVNNVSFYDKEVVYNGKGKSVPVIDITTNLSTANIFMTKLSENLIDYYYVDVNGDSGHTLNANVSAQTSTMQDIPSWGNEFSPFLLSPLTINQLKVKKRSFNVAALKGPKTNIYDKYKTNFNEPLYDESFIKEPIARIIEMNEKEINPRPQVHGETLIYDKTIYRYNGTYEPIFKNISLFQTSDYFVVRGDDFYKEYVGNQMINSGTSFGWIIGGTQCDDILNYVSISGSSSDLTSVSDRIIINDFGFDLDLDTTITGIEVYVKRYADVGPDGTTVQTPYYSGISDKVISIMTGNTLIGDNNALLNIYDDSGDIFTSGLSFNDVTNFWSNSIHEKKYGSTNYLWGLTDLTPAIVNDSSFGLSIKVQLSKDVGYVIYNRANIECVKMKIRYLIDGIESTAISTTVINKNINFDTGYKNFGKMDNIIYSKVNEKENMLKLKNTKEDKSIYPMVDEYGYDNGNKFIFKSSWDDDYYIRTKNELD